MCRVQRVWQCLIVAAFAAASCGPQAAPVSDFAGERYQMIQQQVKARGVGDPRVLAAMSKVRRDEFVPPDVKASSYTDQLRSNDLATLCRGVHDRAIATVE